jgi:hypothetical protein
MRESPDTYWHRLRYSFAAMCTALESPRVARRVLAALLVVHTGLLAYSAHVHSPTLNEPGHLAGGLSHWHFGRFEVYRVNPPLVRMIAALPVLAVGYEADWSGFYDGIGARPEMAMGEDFVAANGERSFWLFTVARWACVPLSWIGAITCFLWARDLYGRPAGVLAATIWCFEPNILAHAPLITADAGATALGLAACYTFWRWLVKPTWTQAAFTGLVLGVAELAKTTLILFYPLWPLMWLVYRWPDQRRLTGRGWLREAGMLTVRMLVGLYVLNLGYGFEGSATRLKEFQFVSDLFTGNDPLLAGVGRDAADGAALNAPGRGTLNRFVGTWLGEWPMPFPKNYLIGIDLQQRDFERYGRPSYLRGEWRDRGWWYYYLYASAIKVPLGLWALLVFIFAMRLSRGSRQLDRDTTPPIQNTIDQTPITENELDSAVIAQPPGQPAQWRDEFILLFPAITIFAVVSSQTGFSEHLRYVLPVFPFVFVWVSQIAAMDRLRPRCAREICVAREIPILSTLSGTAFLAWFVVSSLWIYPHSLSYFNESIGGPLNGPKHLLGSNIDWGQDLRYLEWFTHTHPQIADRLKLVCITPTLHLVSNRADTTSQSKVARSVEYWAISVAYLNGLKCPECGLAESMPNGFVRWKQIGYSIELSRSREK